MFQWDHGFKWGDRVQVIADDLKYTDRNDNPFEELGTVVKTDGIAWELGVVMDKPSLNLEEVGYLMLAADEVQKINTEEIDSSESQLLQLEQQVRDLKQEVDEWEAISNEEVKRAETAEETAEYWKEVYRVTSGNVEMISDALTREKEAHQIEQHVSLKFRKMYEEEKDRADAWEENYNQLSFEKGTTQNAEKDELIRKLFNRLSDLSQEYHEIADELQSVKETLEEQQERTLAWIENYDSESERADKLQGELNSFKSALRTMAA